MMLPQAFESPTMAVNISLREVALLFVGEKKEKKKKKKEKEKNHFKMSLVMNRSKL